MQESDNYLQEEMQNQQQLEQLVQLLEEMQEENNNLKAEASKNKSEKEMLNAENQKLSQKIIMMQNSEKKLDELKQKEKSMNALKESIASKQESMKAQEECICKRKASLDRVERDLEARIKAVDTEVDTKADSKAQKAVERESARLYKEYNVKTGFVFATWGIVFLTGFIHALAVGFANAEWRSFWKAIGIAIANLTVAYWKLCFELQQGEGIMWWGTSLVSLFLFLMPFIIIFVLIVAFLENADANLFFKLLPYFITVYLAVLPYLLPVLPSWCLYAFLVACIATPGYRAVKKKEYW